MNKEYLINELELCKETMAKLRQDIEKETDLDKTLNTLDEMSKLHIKAHRIGNAIISLLMAEYEVEKLKRDLFPGED